MPVVTMTPAASGPEGVLEHIGAGTDVIVPLANGEPVSVLDAIEAHASELEGVRVHQMHVVHDRPYLHGMYGDRLRHVSYFLSHVTRPCFRAGTMTCLSVGASAGAAEVGQRSSAVGRRGTKPHNARHNRRVEGGANRGDVSGVAACGRQGIS